MDLADQSKISWPMLMLSLVNAENQELTVSQIKSYLAISKNYSPLILFNS